MNVKQVELVGVVFHLPDVPGRVQGGLPLDVVGEQQAVLVADGEAGRQTLECERFAVAHAAGGEDFSVEQFGVVVQCDFGGLVQGAAGVQHQGVRQKGEAAAFGQTDAGVLLRRAACVHRQHAGEGLGVERERGVRGQRDAGVDNVACQQAGRGRHLHGMQRVVVRRQRDQLQRRGGVAFFQHGPAVARLGG